MLLLRWCPAGVSVSTAGWAGWIWLGLTLTLELSLPVTALSEPDPGFSLCRQSFYRQTPPLGLSVGGGPLLTPLCHRLPGGQSFATLYHPTCDAAVYSAFHLSQGWGTEKEEEDAIGEEKEDEGSQVMTPALLQGDVVGGKPQAHSDSPLHQWGSLARELIQSSILPQCGSTGGQLYVLTGATGLRLGSGMEEGGDGGCEAGVQWSAVCCAGPEGQSGFSVGVVKETGGGERVVSVKELEHMIGVTDLFSEGCGEANGETEGDIVTLLSDVMVGVVEKQRAIARPDAIEETLDETTDRSIEALPADTEPLITPSVDNETLASESDTESSSNPLVYIITSSVSLLMAPLRPVVSTLIGIPGQVAFVLQEDLGVLSALPGDILSVFYNMASDLVSGVGSVTGLILGVGEMCFSTLYCITAPLVGSLFTSCQDGVTGVGTLAWDGVGIFRGIVDRAWWVSRVVGDQAWEQGGGFVGSVVSEMGGQVKAVGGGMGKLAWRCGNGVGNVVRLAGGLVVGSTETVVENVMEVFGQDQNCGWFGSTENVHQ
ncbi:endonuclease domain-containing 1 protein-like [Oncorhynchus keta]|uniref:endonuclease domain-containing 1 protein-like n=1 Tax=Oncorhynchus keta TaxID=8018 RepID=UPI00227D673D|nr:endonuclease domain-containing 1 protein-like [Oncorhynchus keta]